MSAFLDKTVGRYKTNRPFIARSIKTPDYPRSPKLYQDIIQARLGVILYTDKGAFWAPPIEKISPDLWDNHPERILETSTVEFFQGFRIDNALLVDLQNLMIVKPNDMELPVVVEENDVLSIQFAVDFYMREKCPH